MPLISTAVSCDKKVHCHVEKAREVYGMASDVGSRNHAEDAKMSHIWRPRRLENILQLCIVLVTHRASGSCANTWNILRSVIRISGMSHVQSRSQGAAAEDVSRPSKAKRQKIKLACQACRDRKTRCDGVRPHCSTCIKRGVSTSCEYEATTSVSRR